MNVSPSKRVRILFDEFHSESWSISAQRAREMQPGDPPNASYASAAAALGARDFEVARNLDAPLEEGLLAQTDVLALLHPCDPKWELTTSQHSPALSKTETEAVLAFVKAGGGLLLITEYEHDKYGDNFADLLAPLGLRIVNGKAFDRLHCAHENPEWLIAEPMEISPLAHLAKRACFYRSGWCEATGHGEVQAEPDVTTRTAVSLAAHSPSPQIAWRGSAQAHPAHAALLVTARYGQGRIVLVNDSVLFGDERLGAFDHFQLWLNIAYWLAAPRFCQCAPPAPSTEDFPLLKAVDALRTLQQRDGSVAEAAHPEAARCVEQILVELNDVRPVFPHQADYFTALETDFRRWQHAGFSKPDFALALDTFHPERARRDGIRHLALFPMYTPNASSETRFEALVMRTPWPEWLARLERTAYSNPKFVPGHLVAHTAGYSSDCAVLFPETVSVAARASNHFGVIFCDREAQRLQKYALEAARTVQLALHPELECMLCSMPLILDTLALWDLIHDASHSLGELPFDPFMIRQRAPFWMYGLEELRVDLRSFEEAMRLCEEGFPFARYVGWAMVLDRLFRFPISGTRVKNYDALGGQLLFAFLHQHDVLLWRDNKLALRWDALPEGIHALRCELTALYKAGADCSKVSFWLAAHDLVARYLRPNVASQWKADSRAITDESDPKKWIALVHDDEFPLGSFHVNLQRKLKDI